MKTAHSPHVPHHPGFHVGPIDIEWGSLVIPLVTLAMFLVMAYLYVGQPPEPVLSLGLDPNLMP